MQVFKSSSGQIIFLVALLGAVIGIMVILQVGGLGLKPPAIPKFVEQAKIVDNTCFNRHYDFKISRPNTDWELLCFNGPDSLSVMEVDRSLLESMTDLTMMYRRDRDDTVAIVSLGVIQLNEPRMPHSIAVQSLAEVKKSVFPVDSLHIVSDVTMTGAGTLQGAYYMIRYPEQPQYPYPVQIHLFFVHNRLVYTIICKVKTDHYEYLRKDFEAIIKSFWLFGNEIP